MVLGLFSFFIGVILHAFMSAIPRKYERVECVNISFHVEKGLIFGPHICNLASTQGKSQKQEE
jgi:hypothetical protein